jgi:hypothetical protein
LRNQKTEVRKNGLDHGVVPKFSTQYQDEGAEMNRIGLMARVLALEAIVWLVIFRNIDFLNLNARITGGLRPAWCLTAGAAAFALRVRSERRKRVIFLAVVAAALAANIADIGFDVARYHATLGFDQDHSFLLELPLTAEIAGVGAAIGLAIAGIIRHHAA